MRDLEVNLIDDAGSEQQEVEVEGTWPLWDLTGAVPPCRPLDLESGGEKRSRCEATDTADAGIEEGRLVTVVKRLRFVDRRDAKVREEFAQARQGKLDHRHAVPEVRTHTEKNGLR